MFCVECGKEGKTYDGLCRTCYLERRRFVTLPETLDVQVCGQCYAVRIGDSWRDTIAPREAVKLALDEALVTDREVREAQIELQELIERDPRNYLAKVSVFFKVSDIETRAEADVAIRLKRDSCRRCGRRAGHYFEGMIQLRTRGRLTRERSVEEAQRWVQGEVERLGTLNREIFISKIESMHGGYDFYFSSGPAAKSVARSLASRFGAAVKTSVSAGGFRDGQELRRVTHLVRLPEYLPGDVVEVSGRYFLLRSATEKVMNVQELTSWQESTIQLGRAGRIGVIRREESVMEATVISQGEHELQILDPESLTPVDVVRPAGLLEVGSTVHIVKTKAGIFILPPSRTSS